MDCVTESARKLSISDELNDGEELRVDDDLCDLDLKTGGDGLLRAHKSIVRRCPYFAAMIDGNWIESQTSVVTLNGLVKPHLNEMLPI